MDMELREMDMQELFEQLATHTTTRRLKKKKDQRD